MSNLISRQDAIKIIDQFSREEMFHYMESLELDVKATQICFDAVNAVGTIKEQIEALPSADAVEVVRCKDCKWINDRITCPLNTREKTEGRGFCNRGERREGGEA